MGEVPLYLDSLHHSAVTATSVMSLTSIQKEEGLLCGFVLRKAEVFDYVERYQNLKEIFLRGRKQV